ncbi:hypothetical protein F2Q70_00001009 [Brassica cretica]|uniref:Uncharacterized protein n=1 Tax=Brassica cretica TaxID=69181 RepID=A0A8S9IPQ7_BRACR|nr:hypothetical protein F2Q70_00001009 [Brassica cretica]
MDLCTARAKGVLSPLTEVGNRRSSDDSNPIWFKFDSLMVSVIASRAPKKEGQQCNDPGPIPKSYKFNYRKALGRIRISGKFRVSGSGSVGSVDLISGSGFVVSGYPGFGYPSRYSIIRGYPDPDPSK